MILLPLFFDDMKARNDRPFRLKIYADCYLHIVLKESGTHFKPVIRLHFSLGSGTDDESLGSTS